MDVLLTVETDLFEHKEVKSHFINPCCFGEDFAAWLKREISTLERHGYKFSGPIQEDYGWGFWASHGKDQFWIAISYVGDGPQEAPAQWVISINPDYGLNLLQRILHKVSEDALGQLRNCTRQAIVSNSAIRIVEAPNYE